MALTIIVSNLPRATTEEKLKAHFSSVGRVHRVNLMAGEKDAIAFVEMFSNAEAEKAISMLHEREFEGKLLSVLRGADQPYRQQEDDQKNPYDSPYPGIARGFFG